jgi:hypothetical protein
MNTSSTLGARAPIVGVLVAPDGVQAQSDAVVTKTAKMVRERMASSNGG